MNGTPSRQTAWLIGVFIIIVLVVLVAIPLFLNYRTSSTITQLNEQADPAEKLAAAIQESLAYEVSGIVGFQATGQTRHIRLYKEHEDAIRKAISDLDHLTPFFGPFVQARSADMRAAIEKWHERVEKIGLLKQQLAGEQFRHVFFDREYAREDAHRSTRRFIDSMVNWREQQREKVTGLTQFSAILSVIFAVMAAAAISMVMKILRDIRKAGAELESRATHEETLRRVAHALTGAFTRDDVLRRITETAALTGQAESVYVELIDTNRKEITCVASHGPDVPNTGTKGPYSGSLAEEVLAVREPRIIPNVTIERERRSVFGELAQSCANCTAIVIPLIAENEILGALFLIRRLPHHFTEAEFPHVLILADMAALAIHRAITIDRIQKMQSDEHFLSEAAGILASSLDYQATLKTVVQLAVPRIGDWCAVHLRENSTIRTVEVSHVDPSKLRLVERLQGKFAPRMDDRTGAAQVIRTGKPELYPEITEELLKHAAHDPEHYTVLSELNLQSAIVVPLAAGDNILGALTLATARGRHYGPGDVTFAVDLARHIAMAIQNARLYASAERAVQARDEVLRVVSHDLRNPVGNIQMTAKMLRSPKLTEDKRQTFVEIIDRTAERMHRLIEDLVAVARVREGQAIPVNVQFENPSDILSEAWDLFALQARIKSIRIKYHAPDILPAIKADRHRVLQVLSNLLDNAIKFTPEGGAITLGCESCDDHVLFSVRDTGPGIEAEHLERIFELFWQAKPTAHLGAGFGLTISKAIVEQHGGTIWAESEPGKGTAFFFTIPQATGKTESLGEELTG